MHSESPLTTPESEPTNKDNERRFSIIKIEGGMCQLLSTDYHIVLLPCKYVPFKALRVGQTVRISFRLKQEEMKNGMARFQRHILDSI